MGGIVNGGVDMMEEMSGGRREGETEDESKSNV